MKGIMLIFLSFILLSGCVDQNVVESNTEASETLRTEMATIMNNQDILLNEISDLKDQIDSLTTELQNKDVELNSIHMDLERLFGLNNAQDDYYSSRISEAIRLYGIDQLELKMFIIEAFNYEDNIITVRNKNDEVITYTVSNECKVLVAGLDYIIYQDLVEGSDFINSTIRNKDKVLVVLKDGIIQQIQMYGSGSWW